MTVKEISLSLPVSIYFPSGSQALSIGLVYLNPASKLKKKEIEN